MAAPIQRRSVCSAKHSLHQQVGQAWRQALQRMHLAISARSTPSARRPVMASKASSSPYPAAGRLPRLPLDEEVRALGARVAAHQAGLLQELLARRAPAASRPPARPPAALPRSPASSCRRLSLQQRLDLAGVDHAPAGHADDHQVVAAAPAAPWISDSVERRSQPLATRPMRGQGSSRFPRRRRVALEVVRQEGGQVVGAEGVPDQPVQRGAARRTRRRP